MDDLNLDEIANKLRQEIDASKRSRTHLERVWAEVQKMNECRDDDSGVTIMQNMSGWYFPLYAMKRDAVVADTFAALTGLDPYVQAKDVSQSGNNVDYVEKALTNLADRGDFDLQFRDALGHAFDENMGSIRVRPVVDDKGNVTSIETESISPMRMMGWPTGFKDYDKLKTVGHCYFELAYRIKDACEDGTYDVSPDKITGGGGADPASLDLSRLIGGEDTFMTNDVLDPMDSWVEIWDVVTEIDPKKTGKRTKHAITYDYTHNLILSMDPCGAVGDDGKFESYPCWYVDVRTKHDSEEGFWPRNSVGRKCIGTQNAYNTNWNTIQQGALFSSFGFHVISGGAFSTQAIPMTPGGFYVTTTDVKVQSLDFGFQPQALLTAAEKLETIMDSLVGKTQLGTGQEIAASTSATAVAAMQQGQNEQQDAYVKMVAPSVAKVWKLLWTYLKLHYKSLSKAMPNDIDIPNYALIKDMTLAFEVTGQSGASNPQTLVAKLQALLTMLGTPIQLPPGSKWDVDKIQEKIVEMLDLPFSAKSLMKVWLQGSPEWFIDIVKQSLNEGMTEEEVKLYIRELVLQQAQTNQGQEPPQAPPQQGPPNAPQQSQNPPGGVSATPSQSDPLGAGTGQGSPDTPSLGVPQAMASPVSGQDDGEDGDGHIT